MPNLPTGFHPGYDCAANAVCVLLPCLRWVAVGCQSQGLLMPLKRRSTTPLRVFVASGRHAFMLARIIDPWQQLWRVLYLPYTDLGLTLPAGLMSEALALVDLLVLVRAQRFAGFFMSSYSWVVQARRLSSIPLPSRSSRRQLAHPAGQSVGVGAQLLVTIASSALASTGQDAWYGDPSRAGGHAQVSAINCTSSELRSGRRCCPIAGVPLPARGVHEHDNDGQAAGSDPSPVLPGGRPAQQPLPDLSGLTSL